jgi:hypothetical protein
MNTPQNWDHTILYTLLFAGAENTDMSVGFMEEGRLDQ